MNRYRFQSLLILFLIIVGTTACEKSISEGKLKGNTWTVTDWYYYSGTNYPTYQNIGAEGIPLVDVINPAGTWDFTKDGEVTISVTYQVEWGGSILDATWEDNGTLIMDGRQKWFDVAWASGQKQYFIEDGKGSEIVIVWEQLYGQYGDVNFMTLKK